MSPEWVKLGAALPPTQSLCGGDLLVWLYLLEPLVTDKISSTSYLPLDARFQHLLLYLFFLLLLVELGLHACKAGALLLEIHL
jgi:hypothetical protein